MAYLNKKQMPQIMMLVVLLITTWFRLWQLSHIPPGLSYDEAYNAMDGLWAWKTGHFEIYYPGNIGRPALYPFLAALVMGMLGAMPFTARLASAFLSILLVALTYRWLVILFPRHPDRHWFGLGAAAGSAFSIWHIILSRNALEVMLVPLCLVAMALLFWQGWLTRKKGYFIGAGIILGLSQYSYQSAAMLPVILALFVLLQTIIARSDFKILWSGLIITAIASFIVFLPLGFFIWQHPAIFFMRTTDVSVFNEATGGTRSVAVQMIDSLRLFVDGYSPNNWRHNILREPVFNGLSFIGFWLGLIITLRFFRRPAYLFLLISLVTIWSIAFLSQGISAPRLSAVLPPYYAIMAIGLITPTSWLAHRLSPFALKTAIIFLIFAFSGSRAFNYIFLRWGPAGEVYWAYDAPIADLAQTIIDKSEKADILLPFESYSHPTMRFILQPEFQEVATPPPVAPDRAAILVAPPETILSSLVWLSQEEGTTYIAYPQHPSMVESLITSGESTSLTNPHNQSSVLAQFHQIPTLEPLAPHLADWQALQPVSYQWADDIQLIGYQVWPNQVPAGHSFVALNLAWRSLTGQPQPYTYFVQLVNHQGRSIAQWTDRFLTDKHRWRADNRFPDQHLIWLDPEAPPGPYLIRIGLFTPSTGERAPVYTSEGKFVGDELLLGLFYLVDEQQQPDQPQIPHQVRFEAPIQLLGYTEQKDDPLSGWLHWQAETSLKQDYTISVQLLDSNGHPITGWDGSPFGGLYPTSRWQPEEIVMDSFQLTLPDDHLPSGEYLLVASLHYPQTEERLPIVEGDDSYQIEDHVILKQISIP